MGNLIKSKFYKVSKINEDTSIQRFDGGYKIFVHSSVQNKLHNFTGPALVRKNGEDCEWYINGKLIKPEIYQQWLIDNDIDINNLTRDDQLLIMLTWG